MANAQVKLAKKLIRIAHNNPRKQAELVPKIKALLGKRAGGAVAKALKGFLHHNKGVKAEYKSPKSLVRQVEDALKKDDAEQAKALKGIVHHNKGVKAEYKLPKSLVRQVDDALKSGKKAALAKATSKKAFSKLSRQERWDLEEAMDVTAGFFPDSPKRKLPKIDINAMPGFSPMQLRQHIAKIGTVRQELELMQAQYADALKQMKNLAKEEKAGIDLLKKAAHAMKEEAQFTLEAEGALIKFTAALARKAPGIAQMADNPEDSKWGDKAGDLIGRVAEKLGKEIADAVETIYRATAEDLTHVTTAVRGFKLVTKTSSLDDSTLKTAGIMDAVINVKEWLSGKAKSLFGFMGDIGRWVRGFVERSKLVGKKTNDLKKALASADKQIDKFLAGAL